MYQGNLLHVIFLGLQPFTRPLTVPDMVLQAYLKLPGLYIFFAQVILAGTDGIKLREHVE
ncbi:hypothetical protein D9M69_735020 [compost metagenome]